MRRGVRKACRHHRGWHSRRAARHQGMCGAAQLTAVFAWSKFSLTCMVACRGSIQTFLLQDKNGQIAGTHSISAGLDYPGTCVALCGGAAEVASFW